MIFPGNNGGILDSRRSKITSGEVVRQREKEPKLPWRLDQKKIIPSVTGTATHALPITEVFSWPISIALHWQDLRSWQNQRLFLVALLGILVIIMYPVFIIFLSQLNSCAALLSQLAANSTERSTAQVACIAWERFSRRWVLAKRFQKVQQKNCRQKDNFQITSWPKESNFDG